MEPRKLKDGRYQLVAKLGEGSQGETYDALDTKTSASDMPLAKRWKSYVDSGGKVLPPERSASVAIKCFRVGQAKSWKDVELAEREAKTLASLSHPRMPAYLEHFEEGGALYLVMEKIEGQSVAKLGRSTPDEVTRMLRDVADALRYLHGLSPPIVHRDLKPGNVIRRPDGSFAIVDFGAVRDRLKPAGGSTVVGTFGYMAPEQFQGRASPKSDVYGAAATAMRMLTGEEPESLPHQGLGIDVKRALPETTPKALVRALKAMLEPDPDARVATIDEALALGEGKGVRDEKRTRDDKREKKRKRKARLGASSSPDLADEATADAHDASRAAGSEETSTKVPLPIRLGARLGLALASVVVWLVLGLFVPFALALLSVVLGERLRRAARACVEAARRNQRSLRSASARVSGRVRVDDAPRVRVAAQAVDEGAERADAWLEQRLEKDVQRERMKQHARRPPQAGRGRWGR